MSHIEGKFIQKGNFAYELMHDGWRKGEEAFRNRFSFQVWADKDAGETAEDVTTRLVQCWNDHDDLVKERDELVKALRLANVAMQHMGDVMNGMDIVEDEDIAITSAAFEAVESILAKYPEAS